MTSTVMKGGKNDSGLPEAMQRMITPQYEQIVNEIETIYHHPETGNAALFFIDIASIATCRAHQHRSMSRPIDHGTK
jgi:hypothetical protein